MFFKVRVSDLIKVSALLPVGLLFALLGRGDAALACGVMWFWFVWQVGDIEQARPEAELEPAEPRQD